MTVAISGSTGYSPCGKVQSIKSNQEQSRAIKGDPGRSLLTVWEGPGRNTGGAASRSRPLQPVKRCIGRSVRRSLSGGGCRVRSAASAVSSS